MRHKKSAHRKTSATKSAKKLSRREFFRSSATAATFTIVSPHVLALGGRTPPSEKLNIVGVGAGGGACKHDLRRFAEREQNIVAVADCLTLDAWQGESKRFYKEFYPGAKRYRDFRVMLEKEKGIDAVVIATPDHSHAVITMAAIQLGKHVYCEKPLTRTIWEARQISRAAQEAKIATQMGNNGHAGEWIRLVCEYIWQGVIGPVREVHAWSDRPHWPSGISRPKDTPPVPAFLDWDLWLGPAPERPYHPSYIPNVWRGWVDFGSGAIGDMACHILDPVFWAMKLGHPVSIEASSTPITDENKETYPKASLITYRFPERGEGRDKMPPLTVTWYDGGLMPPLPEGMKPGVTLPKNGAYFVGEKGVLVNETSHDPYLLPESLQKEHPKPKMVIDRSIGHFNEWVAECKGEKVKCGSNFNYGAGLTEFALLGNVALRAGEKIDWDGTRMEVTNVPAANEFLRPHYRSGWAF